MPRFTFQCWSCSSLIEVDAVFRSDTCEKCDADLKTCRSCRHHDDRISNGCRETAADYVHDKERANFCGYFAPREDRVESATEVSDARTKLEALFKK